MTEARGGFDYDVAVIGGGSGGYAAARSAAAAGLRAVVVEGGAEVGGLCILRGCMPTKALLYASEVYHLARHSQPFGVRAPGVSFDFAEVMRRKNRLVKDFADYRLGQLNAGRFAFVRSRPKFRDPHTLELSDGKTLTSAHFVIATGSTLASAPLPQLEAVGYISSDQALELTSLPKSLIMLGGGAVAVEFAQFFQRFGVKVTLVQRGPRLLKEDEPEAGLALEKALRREGMEIFTSTRLTDAWRDGDQKGVTFLHEGIEKRVSAEEIFHGLGRAPNLAGLGLENAGVKTEKGRIAANHEMQTSAPHIYAAGDCVGPHEIVHIAIQQGETAAHNIAHPAARRRMDYRLLTSVVFSDPQVARVGLTEKACLERSIPYIAASYPFNDHGKSMIMEALDGFVKLVADPVSGEILGGTCVGPMGGELIHEIIACMHKRMTVRELAAMPHYHPTLAEIWTYPAEELAEKLPG